MTYNELYNNPNIIINSFDILNSNETSNIEIHTYEKKYLNNYTCPIFGIGYDIINNFKNKCSEFIYDSRDNFIKNYKLFMSYLDLPDNNNILNLLFKYNYYNLCIWNKQNDLFIQWLVISVDDFINFLEENQYKYDFIDYIKNNKDDYKYISHEITIVYDRDTLKPIRSGFYGCL